MTKEEKILLKGGVVYEDNRGYESDNDYEGDYDNDDMYIADLMYEYPKKQIAIPKLKVEPIIIEEPVVYERYEVSIPVKERERTSRLRDIVQEQERIAQEARVQRRNYKREEKPKKERIDYINKKKKEVGNVRDFGIVQNEQNIVMKPKSKRVEKEKKDYEEIARMFYPTMEEKSQIVVKNKEPIILAQAPISQEPKMITLADKEYSTVMMNNQKSDKISSIRINRKRDRNNRKIIKDNTKKDLLENLVKVFVQNNPYWIFWKNYNDMKKENVKLSDKYFHSKANCESAQKGQIIPALGLSILREITDTPANLIKGYSLEESFIDSAEDMKANLYGINKGKLYPNVSCKYLVNKYRPNGLDERF